MALKLKWKNPNKGTTTIDIYRGTTPNVDLTTPLVTLSNGELEYIDTTALFDQTYYYVWAVNTANDRVVSRPQKIEVTDRRGPGSNVLLQGNEDYGFYGTVTSADFVSSAPIVAAAKTQTGLPTGVLYPLWYKFTRKGKILFVPNVTFGKFNWNTLYNAGLIFGTNDTGPKDAGTVNQLVTVDVNGDLFLVRCPTGYPEGMTWDGGNLTELDSLAGAETHYCEYDDLMLPILPFTPARQRMVTIGNEPYSNFFLSLYASTAELTTGVCCKEFVDPTYVLVRGGGWDNRYATPDRNYARKAQRIARTTGNMWWPVLEYVGRTDEVDLSKL